MYVCVSLSLSIYIYIYIYIIDSGKPNSSQSSWPEQAGRVSERQIGADVRITGFQMGSESAARTVWPEGARTCARGTRDRKLPLRQCRR